MSDKFAQYAAKAVVAFVAPFLVLAAAWAAHHAFDMPVTVDDAEGVLYTAVVSVVTAVGVYLKANAVRRIVGVVDETLPR